MQRGIDSYFKKAAKKVEDGDTIKTTKKRKARVISSDEDDEVVEATPTKDTNKIHDNKKLRTDDGDNKTSRNISKKPSLSKLKDTTPKTALTVVDPSVLFGGETVRVEAKKPLKPKEQLDIEMEDNEIDRSLLEIDMDEINEKSSKKKTPKKTPTKSDRTPKKMASNQHVKEHHSQEELKEEKQTKDKKKRESNEHVNDQKESKEKSTPSPAKKRKHEDESIVQHKKTPKQSEQKPHTPRVKKEHHDLDSSVLSDEERHERKRMAAILYQKYKNRSSCLNHGSKEVPQGTPNCLAGLTFLITGVLESLERDEAGSIIKEYGGKLMTTVGKRLNYLIVGEDAGPKKLAQAEDYGIKILSEDGLFDLIRAKSGGKSENNLHSEKPTTSKSPKNARNHVDEVKIKKEKTPKKIKEEPVKEQHKAQDDQNNIDIKIKEEKPFVDSSSSTKEVDKTDNNNNALAWVDKYKPKTLKEIVGQQGAASNLAKLTNWLSKWYINHDGKKKLQKPNPWAKNDDGSFYKAALLSGPPGIGKTTTATLVCKELGFDIVEFNASDTRSKRLLKEEVSELLHNKSLFGFCHGQSQAMSKKHVLIMDEVDGMAGNEDRGGMQELIALIKDSSVPIICMCNDRNHPKIRSLVNYCYDLRFTRPRVEQIKAMILSICFKEKLKIPPTKIEEIIKATNQDIRQTINHIALLSAGKELNLKSDQAGEKIAQKDLKLGPWEVVRKVFSVDEHKHMTLNDKCDLFFHDYSLAPLFVQQNYLQVSPAGPKSEIMKKVALTADALSLGDLVDKRIRSNSAWALLPTQAVFSSFLPGEYMCGYFTGQINFPGWLGKNSRSSKRHRLAQEIHDHTRVRTSGSRLSVRQDYAPFLLEKIVRPLRQLGMEGVEESLSVLKEYHLLREDIDSLIELTTWPGKKGPMDAVDGRVKAALTRSYNKEVLAYSYSAAAGIKKKKAEATDDLELADIEGANEDGEAAIAVASDEDDDDLANDGLIKAKKKTTTTSTKPATSKAKTSSSSTSKKPTTSKTTSKSKK